MGVANRTLDPSEQKKTFDFEVGALGVGVTICVIAVPYTCSVASAALAVTGVSGSPTLDMKLYRFVVGAGLTSWSIGATTAITPTVYGTSGMVSVAIGASVPVLQANDMIGFALAGANSNVLSITGGVVLQALQDIKTQFGA